MWNVECCDCDERGIRYDAGWRMGSSFHLVCGVAHVIRRVTRRAPESTWESPIFPVLAWRAGQASSEIWGSTLVTFTMKYSFRTIHIDLPCEGIPIKVFYKVSNHKWRCVMLEKGTLKL